MEYYIELLKQISLDNKYTKWYLNIINSKTLDAEYYENHHIVPKSFDIGGEKDLNNIVKLSAKQHYICHLLLTKMFTGKYKNKMVYAYRGFMGVMNSNQTSRHNSRLYNFLKSKLTNTIKNIRLYKNQNVKHIHPDEVEIINNLISDGWTRIMPEEYKPNRVGNMLGKKHSIETKLKMSRSSHRTRKPQTEQHKENISKALRGRVQSETEKMNRTEALKKLYENNLRSNRGEKNPNFGRRKIINTITLETKYVLLIELENYLLNGWQLKRKR